MPVPVVTHTGRDIAHCDPNSLRPVTMTARDLDDARQLQPHRHPYGQLTLALDGVLQVRAEGGSWIVPPQRAVWIAPDVEHAVIVVKAARLRAIFIAAARAPFPGVACKVVEVSPLLRELVQALAQEDQAAPTPRATRISELILDELPRLSTLPVHLPMPADKRLRALCDALLAAPDSKLTLAQWAQQVGASERTLARLAEKELGMPFGQWRQQARLAHAAPLIARGMPLSQVAAQLGYASQSAFSAMFRKTFGCPPSAFIVNGKQRH